MEASSGSEFSHFTPSHHHLINTPERRLSCSGDPFIVEDLLDFSNDDTNINGGVVLHDTNNNNISNNINNDNTNVNASFDNLHHSNNSDDSTVVTPVDSCNSSFSGNNDSIFPPAGDIGSHFSGELGVPYDDLAELEWLSNFVEESFSSEDLHKFHLIPAMSAMKTRTDDVSETRYYPTEPTRAAPLPTSPIFSPEMAVPGKARSKRSRAAPCNWASRLLVLAPGGNEQVPITKPTKSAGSKKKGSSLGGIGPMVDPTSGGEVRKCLHCATDKTPQWRTGPMGPKTLCNACGVRYKSGRLVPEYRPAASPTFMLTKHSNSHRKVIELRRQKELMRQQQMQQQQHQYQQLIHHNPNTSSNMMFDPSNGDDYLIHQHIGSDYRQLI
ncbi:GATA transcription factor 12-like [Chenopodium quinoa]|uniref:GATA transcription factor 12-like n=1 Tax=Chenopodium quinoa TaxID=63459 RepID=UPI000B774443|nr:GATA transcription factor 12-like [Chenopodium quinoa]